MNYCLKRLVFGSSVFVPITADEYQEIVAADAGLLEALALEEKFDQLIENYMELEGSLLMSTLRDMLFGESDFLWFQREKSTINRKLINLLSACRGYLDFVKPYGRSMLLTVPASSEFDAVFAKHYETTLGYRVMETLRNHVQHRGFPIHALEFNSSLDAHEQRNRFSYGVSIYVKAAHLRRDKVFKAAVLAELEALGDRIDLKPLFRDYVAALGVIHELARSAHKSAVGVWDDIFFSSRKRFSFAFPDEPSIAGLVASKVSDRSEYFDEIHLSTGFIERRKHLETKNCSFGNFSRRYVTGQVIQRNIK